MTERVMENTSGTPRGGTPRLELRGINKTFGAVRALVDVDFDIYAGEVVGLVGDNGAGKSTLVKTIAGAYQPDSGEIFIEGQQVHLTTPQEATRLGIETVYQDLALCDNLDVVKNMFLGREERRIIIPGILSQLKDVDMERRTLEVLRSLDVKIPSVRVPVSGLSGGQRQSIAVAKTVLRDPKVVLLDEPTAALGVAQTRQVLNLIRRLREKGLAVVVISHNMRDVFEVVDRVQVMRLGRKAGLFDIKTSTPEQIVGAITGATAGSIPSALTKEI